MNKIFSLKAVRRASFALKRSGIWQMGFLLLGGPGETKESVNRSPAYVDSLDLNALKINIGIRIYPFTALAKIAEEQGVISKKDDLLIPRFYIVEEIKDWLKETVGSWVADRPNRLIEAE